MANFLELHGLEEEDIKLLEILAERLRKKAKGKPTGQKRTAEGETTEDVLTATAGAWKDSLDCEEFKRRIYENRLATCQ